MKLLDLDLKLLTASYMQIVNHLNDEHVGRMQAYFEQTYKGIIEEFCERYKLHYDHVDMCFSHNGVRVTCYSFLEDEDYERIFSTIMAVLNHKINTVDRLGDSLPSITPTTRKERNGS